MSPNPKANPSDADDTALPRQYSVKDIDWFIDVYRAGGEVTEAEIAGMEKLASALRHYELMSGADIEREIHKHFSTKAPG